MQSRILHILDISIEFFNVFVLNFNEKTDRIRLHTKHLATKYQQLDKLSNNGAFIVFQLKVHVLKHDRDVYYDCI